MKIDIGLTNTVREEIRGALSKFLADVYAIYLKTQKFHWNVKGDQFFSLHLMLEKQYEEMAEEIDEVAERIQTLGFTVEASFGIFKDLTTIPEEGNIGSAKEMLELLIQGHEVIVRNGRYLATMAEKHADVATVDMMGRRIGGHEKILWMLRSHL